jgi:hypothetical protein
VTDAVEKVGGEHLASNNRIETSESLNRRCVIDPCFESMLLAWHPQNPFSTVSTLSGQGTAGGSKLIPELSDLLLPHDCRLSVFSSRATIALISLIACPIWGL